MSSTNYYEKRDAKVRIAEELSNMGWKIYGFHEDQSDSMTDYYCPASWSGLASKNGYILVVDCRYEGKETEITKRNPNYIQMSNADQTKIASLKNMTTSNGATTGESENAQKLIEKLQAKYQGQECDMWEVIGFQPAHLGNSKGCIWHLEKDGALVDKGNKLTIFSDVPDSYRFDINTMQYKDSYKTYVDYEYNEETGYNDSVYKERTLSESELKAVNEFKSFILRLERIVNFGNSCGDGTKETEEAFQQQNEEEKMIKKTFEKVKKVVKLEEIKRESELQVGDIVYCSSGLCMIKEVRENLYWSVKLGSASRGYQESNKITWTLSRKSFDNGILKGTLKVYNKIEVEEVETVEKWVKATTKTTKKETVKAETTPETKEEVKEQNTTVINNVEFTVSEDIHTKTQEKIYVAKLVERVEKDEFMTILSKIKKLGGYYYKYKGGFIFSEDPTELLKNNFSDSANQQEKNIIDDDIESLKNTIIEESGHIIENLNLVKFEYWNNEEYKSKLLQVIKHTNITKNQFKRVIEAIENDIDSKHYIRLIEVLKGFYALDNSNNKNNSNKSDDKEKLINKIDKQLESNNNKIEKLSGNYLTNTWKRMREQESRDKQREAFERDNIFLQCLKNKIEINNASGFEKALIVRILREDFYNFYRRYNYNIKDNKEDIKIYPKINPCWEVNSTWNQDTQKQIKRLKEINLNDDRQLKNCLKNDYKEIINSLKIKIKNQKLNKKLKNLKENIKWNNVEMSILHLKN